MSDKITDAELADRLGVLCDFVQDSTQCFNPWPDEALKVVRELIGDLKLGNRPRSVFANAVNYQTPRYRRDNATLNGEVLYNTNKYQLSKDQVENSMKDWENIPEDRRHSIQSIVNRAMIDQVSSMDLEAIKKLYPLGILR